LFSCLFIEFGTISIYPTLDYHTPVIHYGEFGKYPALELFISCWKDIAINRSDTFIGCSSYSSVYNCLLLKM